MPKRILIVDDEPDFLRLTEVRLKSWGYEVMTALNCQEAFDLVTEKPPDLILLDVMMPGKDGYEVCNELKSRELTRAIPVILFTAQPDQKQRVKTNYEFLAADDCIMKPFESGKCVRIRVAEPLSRAKNCIKEFFTRYGQADAVFGQQFTWSDGKTHLEITISSRVTIALTDLTCF